MACHYGELQLGLTHGKGSAAYIFFLTSIWPSRLSYSFRIFAFSDSSSCSFSMLKS